MPLRKQSPCLTDIDYIANCILEFPCTQPAPLLICGTLQVCNPLLHPSFPSSSPAVAWQARLIDGDVTQPWPRHFGTALSVLCALCASRSRCRLPRRSRHQLHQQESISLVRIPTISPALLQLDSTAVMPNLQNKPGEHVVGLRSWHHCSITDTCKHHRHHNPPRQIQENEKSQLLALDGSNQTTY